MLVVSHPCCCYACGDHGDLFMPRKYMLVCYAVLAEYGGVYDVVHVVYNVVLMVVMVDICCGCVDCAHGKLLEVKWWFSDGLCCFSSPCSEL